MRNYIPSHLLLTQRKKVIDLRCLREYRGDTKSKVHSYNLLLAARIIYFPCFSQLGKLDNNLRDKISGSLFIRRRAQVIDDIKASRGPILQCQHKDGVVDMDVFTYLGYVPHWQEWGLWKMVSLLGLHTSYAYASQVLPMVLNTTSLAISEGVLH